MIPPWPILAAAIEAARLSEREAAARLRAVPGIGAGPMGLTPDSVKAGPAYREARAYHAAAFERLRALNGLAARHYRPQCRAAAIASRAAGAVT